MGLSIIYTWLSNNTHGNLLLAILLHAELNVMTSLWQAVPDAPSAARILMMLSLIGTGLSILLVLGYGPRTLARQSREGDLGALTTSQPAPSK